MTPSTHENTEFLSINNAQLNKDIFLRFALYDAECEYVQLCFSVPKLDRTLIDGNKITLNIDGNTVDQHSLITRTTWRRQYVMFLLSDVKSFSKIDFTYDNQTVNATKSKA